MAAASARSIVGAVPFAGPLFTELVTNVIPNQRVARLELYVRMLSTRLEAIEAPTLAAKITDLESVELFEKGAIQSARAVSDSRREQIARLVACGISGRQKERLEAKRLLSLMNEIDDEQLIILSSHLRRNRNNDAFQRTHTAVLRARPPDINEPDPARRDSYALHILARDQLLRLKLLRHKFKAPRKGEAPEFDDQTGTLKSTYRDLTPLGRLLLTRIGAAEPGEF